MTLDPRKKKLLMIGIPVVVGLALFVILKGKKSSASSSSTTDTSTTSSGSTIDTQAVDQGQLSAFESTVSDQLAQILSGQSHPTTTPAPSASPPGPSAPAAAPAPAAPDPATLPGYGAGVSQLEAMNGDAVASAPGIAGYKVTYNGVPIS